MTYVKEEDSYKREKKVCITTQNTAGTVKLLMDQFTTGVFHIVYIAQSYFLDIRIKLNIKIRIPEKIKTLQRK